MNPLTQIKNTQKATQREIAAGLNETASWHARFKHSAYIFSGGLDYDLTEGDLLAVFAQYGEIVDVNLVRDNDSGKSKGFAFLAYEDQRSTVVAVDNLNGAKVAGRTIRVEHVDNYRKLKEEMDGGEQPAGGMTAEYAAGGGGREEPPASGRWEHDKAPKEAEKGPVRPASGHAAPWEAAGSLHALLTSADPGLGAKDNKEHREHKEHKHHKHKKEKKEKDKPKKRKYRDGSEDDSRDHSPEAGQKKHQEQRQLDPAGGPREGFGPPKRPYSVQGGGLDEQQQQDRAEGSKGRVQEVSDGGRLGGHDSDGYEEGGRSKRKGRYESEDVGEHRRSKEYVYSRQQDGDGRHYRAEDRRYYQRDEGRAYKDTLHGEERRSIAERGRWADRSRSRSR